MHMFLKETGSISATYLNGLSAIYSVRVEQSFRNVSVPTYSMAA